MDMITYVYPKFNIGPANLRKREPIISSVLARTFSETILHHLMTMTSHQCHSVSTYRQINGLFNNLPMLTIKKISKLYIAISFWGNPRVAGGFSPKGPEMQKALHAITSLSLSINYTINYLIHIYIYFFMYHRRCSFLGLRNVRSQQTGSRRPCKNIQFPAYAWKYRYDTHGRFNSSPSPPSAVYMRLWMAQHWFR